MKRILVVMLIAISASLMPAGTDLTNVPEKRIKYPSDLLAKGTNGTTPFTASFILRPIQDFRLIYCDRKTLQERVQSSVCILDVASSGDNHKEVKISGNTTLGDVMKREGYQSWRPGLQPAIRLVTKRAILADSGEEQFLNTKISPGDFIVILLTD
jgi:hypothetical protein